MLSSAGAVGVGPRFAHYLKEFHTRLFDGFRFGSACFFFALVKQHAITLHHEHWTGLQDFIHLMVQKQRTYTF